MSEILMPKRTDIQKILILGSGPIIIGQSAEFDYSGTQACKALKSEGYEVVLANSNPATIMTDPESADRTYIEPLTLEYLEEIIRIEREMSPGAGFAVLPTVGGQTALNLAIELSDGGVLEKYNVILIGANVAAIKKAEDRLFFKDAMQKIGLDVPKSALVNNTKTDSSSPARSDSPSSSVRRSRSAARAAASPTTAKRWPKCSAAASISLRCTRR